MALSCTIFEIFDFEKYCDLKIRVRRHSRSWKLVPFQRIDKFPKRSKTFLEARYFPTKLWLTSVKYCARQTNYELKASSSVIALTSMEHPISDPFL